ncbi:Unknown protein, partial [Striga hermonthica]
FPDVKSFRHAIKEAAIAQHFELRIIKSTDLVRYIAKCAVDNCSWRVRAVNLPNSSTFAIRSLDPTHTCGKKAHACHHQASINWIVSFIGQNLRENMNYKPKDILQDVYKEYGITIPYKQAWRARERGLQDIYGSSEEGYYFLPAYCEQIRKTNPGSIAEVFTSSSDNHFERLFISFRASLCGFVRGCLPIIGLGGVQLKSKYLCTLLSATSVDPDALETCTEILPNIIFLSKWEKGVGEAVKRNFSGCSHYVCMKHLSESIIREFKNPRLVHILWKAVHATTAIAFREKMAELDEISKEAADWLAQYPPAAWALV